MKARKTTNEEHEQHLCDKVVKRIRYSKREQSVYCCDRPATFVYRKRYYCGLHVPEKAEGTGLRKILKRKS